MSELDELLLMPKDDIHRELFSDYMATVTETTIKPCPYRYDSKLNLIYKETINYKCRFTYIMRSRIPGLYKIGHTENPSARFKNIQDFWPYSLLELKPLALCNEDVESILKILTGCEKQKRPYPFDKTTELLYISEDDLLFILTTFGFSFVSGEKYPSSLKKICRDYFHPLDGHYIYTTISYESQQL